jgi:hypothetical protein
MAWKQTAPAPRKRYETPKGVMDMTFNQIMTNGGQRKEYY